MQILQINYEIKTQFRQKDQYDRGKYTEFETQEKKVQVVTAELNKLKNLAKKILNNKNGQVI